MALSAHPPLLKVCGKAFPDRRPRLVAAAHGLGVCKVRASMEIKLYDTVRLLLDRSDLGLRRGDTGVVVDVHTRPELGCDVEFMDDRGRGKGVWIAGFSADEVERVEPRQ